MGEMILAIAFNRTYEINSFLEHFWFAAISTSSWWLSHCQWTKI